MLQSPPELDNKDSEIEKLRLSRAFWLSVIGLTWAALLVVLLCKLGFDKAADITSIVGLFTSVLGTLVGAFFGLQIGAAGKEKAERRADEAQKKVNALQEVAPPDIINVAHERYPMLFK